MLKELLLATIVSTSLSVRTPNDVEKELDYEFSVKIENTNKNFQYLLKRDWERELGEKYIDEVFKFSHKINDFINKKFMFKLFIQELEAQNVCLRLSTEK